MNDKPMKIYFIHSSKLNYNDEVYLPVLRSNELSKHELLLQESSKLSDKYYKDVMKSSDLIIVNLTDADSILYMMVRDACELEKPILAMASSLKGYDSKYKKLFKNVFAYSNSDDVRIMVEEFVSNYKGKIIGGKVDPTIVLGTLN